VSAPRLVSVIIPTHNRSATLRRTLDALAVQTHPLNEIQVIVVADGCVDDTVPMLRRYAAPIALRVIEQPGRGAATARNRAATEADGKILIFLDDDIVPVPTFIEAHVRMHQCGEARVVSGYSVPMPQDPVDFYGIEARKWWEGAFQAMREPGHRYTYRDVFSGNLSIGRELWSQVGGFDSAYRDCGGEDYELGVRLLKVGATLAFAAGARGDHGDLRDLDRSFQRSRQDGRADVLLAQRHPELRPALMLSRLETSPSSRYRLVRTLAFRSPSVGDSLAAGLRRVLDALERARLRHHWQRISGVVRAYWYWRGVAEQVGDQQEFIRLLQGGPAVADLGGEIELDLRGGLPAAERRLDEVRPMGARLSFGRQPVGRIPPEPGAEPLRGAHLRPFLVKRLAVPLLMALAAEKATGAIDNSGGVGPDALPRSLS
jgi:glycosyltransferase involved in cell wall biosynthesis